MLFSLGLFSKQITCVATPSHTHTAEMAMRPFSARLGSGQNVVAVLATATIPGRIAAESRLDNGPAEATVTARPDVRPHCALATDVRYCSDNCGIEI
jgi:hypothetical protein